MPKNGSAFAIEGLTSPDGLVLGKMCHKDVAKSDLAVSDYACGEFFLIF